MLGSVALFPFTTDEPIKMNSDGLNSSYQSEAWGHHAIFDILLVTPIVGHRIRNISA
ncbi:MAG: hypothetical protein WCF03_10085 [Nitrososphaeraceae archaeon]